MTVNKQEGNVAGSRIQPAIPIAGVFFKFLLFNAIWCYYTTFTPFSCWESYATALAATLVLSVPYILTRRIAASILVMVVLDIWMVANLLYYLSELFFRHSLIKLPIGRKSDRFSTECGSFIPMVRRTISCFNCRCRVFYALEKPSVENHISVWQTRLFYTAHIFMCTVGCQSFYPRRFPYSL